MSRSTDPLGAAGAAYLHDTAISGEPEVHARLRERTAELSNAVMQISPEQGRLMGLLVQLLLLRGYDEMVPEQDDQDREDDDDDRSFFHGMKYR